MYVCTFSNSKDSNIFFKSVILMIDVPPTLIARRKAIYLLISDLPLNVIIKHPTCQTCLPYFQEKIDLENTFTKQIHRNRHLSFSGVKNFRDLGGYQTEEGKSVRWGVLYR